jgi:hypothetical protein
MEYANVVLIQHLRQAKQQYVALPFELIDHSPDIDTV